MYIAKKNNETEQFCLSQIESPFSNARPDIKFEFVFHHFLPNSCACVVLMNFCTATFEMLFGVIGASSEIQK